MTVLENFKEINRIMTQTFLKNKQLDKKFANRLPADLRPRREYEENATSQMSQLMKKMHSPKEFRADYKKVGEPSNYQNVKLARHIMISKERSIGKRSKA